MGQQESGGSNQSPTEAADDETFPPQQQNTLTTDPKGKGIATECLNPLTQGNVITVLNQYWCQISTVQKTMPGKFIP